ncbi:hypothetical protein GCM10010339_62710 [Streptomyces alanosinicus]|uniref:Helicase-associated domain-containing protein n=1 Tax=Streptomyces alanosinicus TaxID=68171 RepID=A0A918YNQ9_9ACTN|nr:hypothetical protein GCM10010339_62710 [Streptomyces alanosinicus]
MPTPYGPQLVAHGALPLPARRAADRGAPAIVGHGIACRLRVRERARTGWSGPWAVRSAWRGKGGCAAPWHSSGSERGVGPISRSHVETVPDGSEVNLGVLLSNAKTRRARLSTTQLQRLASLGLQWATHTLG